MDMSPHAAGCRRDGFGNSFFQWAAQFFRFTPGDDFVIAWWRENREAKISICRAPPENYFRVCSSRRLRLGWPAGAAFSPD
jgi:hypothetical protein